VRQRYSERKEQEENWVLKLNIKRIDNVLWPLYVGFICLNFLDIYSTALAMSAGPAFYELNRFAAALFGLDFFGYLVAIALKFMPALPLFYCVFAKDPNNKHPIQIRSIKYAALIVLIAGDIVYLAVMWNNLPILMSGIFSGTVK
jgi:Domain of unknown function (DUF5658)